ncbi:MAG TPA: sulfite exporter TauE/SafE family protein [Paenirhodobacter sp.]
MFADLFSSPAEFWVTVAAVVLVGLSKGGLAGLSLLGVPLMALVMSPVTAAAVLLPVLVVMDVVSVAQWRKWVDWGIMRRLLPGAVLGVAIGWLTAEMVSDAVVRLIVGVVSALFVARAAFGARGTPVPVTGKRPLLAGICGTAAGYTSFVAHAGAPPVQIYMMPLRLDPRMFTGTMVMFFALTNALKLIPYAALGEFDSQNLGRAALMFPLAVVATWVGGRIVHHMKPQVFYPVTYVSVAVIAVKLIWDGLAGL